MPTLQFKGKSIVSNLHLAVKYHQLLPNPATSLTDHVSLSDNLLIHGDNLLALKALLPNYAGKVKCIYIDPPYNTGNEGWRYNDNVNSPMMQEWLRSHQPVDKEDLTRHDKWLCMMMPRLNLLRELLSDDGVIFISIDDNEVHHLRMLMDEVFGEQNFLATLVWKRRQNVDSRAKTGLSIDHEYLVIYRKAELIRLRGQEKDLTKYSNPDNDPLGPWLSADLTGLATREQRPNLHYDLVDPVTGNIYPCPENGWRYGKPTMTRMIESGRIIWPPLLTGRPRVKRYQNELVDEFTGLSSILTTVYNTQGTRELKEVFYGKEVFDFPKPVDYIKLLLLQATALDFDAIVLDSFAGSGTTGQAVLELNKEDGGNRKFILLETEDYADSLTAERLRRVIRGVPDAKDEKLRVGLGGSFSYFDLGAPLDIEGVLSGEALPSYADLARYLFYTATGEEYSPEGMNEAECFIGESREYRVYLFYKAELDYLQRTSLTLEMIKSLPADDSKPRLVFAPARFVDPDYLDQYKVKYVQLPFEIFRTRA